MKKFNVSGVVLANVFANGIEANTKEEAIEKYKNMFESKDFVDWADWHDIDAEEAIDYAEKVSDVLKRMEIDCTYKVSGVPEIVFDCGDFLLFSVNFESSIYPTIRNVYFIVMDGTNEVFLPVVQGYNSIISFNYMCGDKPFKDNLNKVFFSNGKDILLYVPALDEFAPLEKKGTKTVLGNRINYILKKANVNQLSIVSSNELSIVMTSNNKKIVLNAEYDSEFDEIPYRLTKFESIIG